MFHPCIAGVLVWGTMFDTNINIPSPSDWGWNKTPESFTPQWSFLPDIWKSARELIHCKCKSVLNLCGRKCKCRMANPPLPCTGLCLCEGDCAKL